MTESCKRQRELFHGKDAQRLLPGLFSGELMSSDKPDLFFRATDGRLIGVEVTEVFHPTLPGDSPLQAQEALRSRVVSLARGKCAVQIPLQVGVIFNDSYPLTKRAVQRVAERLAQIAEQHCPPLGQHVTVSYTRGTRAYFPREVDSVIIYCIDGVDESFWSAPGSAYIPGLTVEALRSVVEEKSQLTQTYRTNCDEIWLLIAADGRRLSSIFIIDECSFAGIGKGSFDRAFLLYNRVKLIELSVGQESMAAAGSEPSARASNPGPQADG